MSEPTSNPSDKDGAPKRVPYRPGAARPSVPGVIKPAGPRPANTEPQPGAPRPAPGGPARAASPAGLPASPARPSGRNVQTDRAALGLSSVRPSEMIEGLDQVVERAEKQEKREQEKRRSGGKLNTNVALHVDDTGKRWAWMVRLGLLASLLLVVGLGVFLVYRANNPAKDPKLAAEETRQILADLELHARHQPVEDGATLTAESVKTRIVKDIDDALANLHTGMEKDRKAGRPVDGRSMRERERLTRLRELRDGWGQPLQFSMEDAGTLVIAPQSKGEASKTVEPRNVKLQTKDKDAK